MAIEALFHWEKSYIKTRAYIWPTSVGQPKIEIGLRISIFREGEDMDLDIWFS